MHIRDNVCQTRELTRDWTCERTLHLWKFATGSFICRGLTVFLLVEIHEYLFYLGRLSNNFIIFFVVEIVPIWVIRNSFRMLLCPILSLPLLFLSLFCSLFIFLLPFSYFLALQTRCFRLICVAPAPNPDSNHFSRETQFFLLENGI